MEEKFSMHINAEVENIEQGKELLEDLKALSNKYDVSIALMVHPVHQEFYEPI